MKSKGYTLVELVVALCIVGILCSFEIRFLNKALKSYLNNSQYVKSEFSMDDALNTIEKYIEEYPIVNVLNDQIELASVWDERNSKEIKFVNKKLEILSYEMIPYKRNMATNVIMNGVEEFKVQKRDKVILITIKSIKGKVKKRFIPLME